MAIRETRVPLPGQELQVGMKLLLPDTASHWLGRVLRLPSGASLRLFNGDGWDYSARFLPARHESHALVEAQIAACAEPPAVRVLVQAMAKGEKLDWILEKATELGVGAIHLMNSARSEKQIAAARLDRRMQHWQKVILAACAQSGRARIPQLHTPASLAELAAQLGAGALLLSPDSDRPLAQACLGRRGPACIVVGPEGGFDDQEQQIWRQAGAIAVHLGARVLRTETAGLAALAVLEAMQSLNESAGEQAPVGADSPAGQDTSQS